MKLLLASAGITNAAIAEELVRLCGKKASDVKVGFVPTAANAEMGNKDWFFAQTNDLTRFGFEWIDVVDIAVPGVDWRARLSDVDVVFVGGGNTFYLLDQLRRVGFKEWFNNQEDKIYVGASAGSIVASPTIEVATLPPADPNVPGLTDFTALEWVDFEFEPHCDEARIAEMGEYAAKVGRDVYALDDASAVSVVGDEAKIISDNGIGQLIKK